MSDDPTRHDRPSGPGEGGRPTQPGLEGRWDRVRAEMERAEFWLGRQGSIVLKPFEGRRYWVLRFRFNHEGRRRQGMIFIGREEDGEVLRRARELLARFRSEAMVLKLISRSARQAARARRGALRASRSARGDGLERDGRDDVGERPLGTGWPSP